MSSQSSLRKNAVLNTIKQICTIIYPIITFPYISRVLGKYYYGKVNFSNSIVSYILMIAALGITNYSIREGSRIKDDRKELQKFCNQIFSINICSMIVAYIVLFLLICFWKKLDGYTLLLLIQASTVLFNTIGTDWINSIFEDYEFITIRYIICQGIAVVLMLLLVHSKNDYLLYAVTCSIGTILANIMNVTYIRKHYDLHPRLTLHMDLHRNMKPIFMLFGSAIATTIYVNSDITILGLLKNESEVGLYTVSSKFYTMLKQMLNASLTVAVPRISHERDSVKPQTLNRHLSQIIGSLIIFSFPISAGLFSLARNIIVLFSGVEYEMAFTSLQILSVSIIFATMASFFINVIMISFGMETQVLFATMFSALINIVLNFVLIPAFGQNAAAFTTLLSEISIFCLGIFYTRKRVKISIRRNVVIAATEFAAVMVICAGIRHFLSSNNFITIFLCVILCAAACLGILFCLDKDDVKKLIHFRK